MAKQGMSPIERLAKGLVKPVAVKQTTTPPVPPTIPFVDPFDVQPAFSVPGNKPFTGPTLDPDIVKARRELRDKSIDATRAGVPAATVQSIQTGQGDPDRGFLGIWNDTKKGLKAVYNYDFGDTGIKPFVEAANFDPIKGDKEFKPVLSPFPT